MLLGGAVAHGAFLILETAGAGRFQVTWMVQAAVCGQFEVSLHARDIQCQTVQNPSQNIDSGRGVWTHHQGVAAGVRPGSAHLSGDYDPRCRGMPMPRSSWALGTPWYVAPARQRRRRHARWAMLAAVLAGGRGRRRRGRRCSYRVRTVTC